MRSSHPLPASVLAVAETARGRARRPDPVVGSSGGPAGNARLTAWLGFTLLVLFLAELVTVLNVRGLLTWHVALGALLIPPSLAKTATTGWRVARYYTGSSPYVEAGPPPLLLRALGPLVVLSTLAVLGTGVVVELLGPDQGRQALVRVVGFGVSALTLHQASVIVWAATTGLHLVARLLPALHLLRRPDPPLPGGRSRVLALVATGVAAAVLAPLLLTAVGNWPSDDGRGESRRHRGERHRPLRRRPAVLIPLSPRVTSGHPLVRHRLYRAA